MNIEQIRTWHVGKPVVSPIEDAAAKVTQRELVLIEVRCTDGTVGRSFLTGIGSLGGTEMRVIRTIIDDGIGPELAGEDGRAICRWWPRIEKLIRRLGRKGAAVRALSGVELAVWDAIGRRLGEPVYRLWGGYRRPIRAYITGGYYCDRPFAEELKEYVRRGYGAIKIKVGVGTWRDGVERVAEARDAVGPRIDIMVDVNEAWDRRDAWHFCKGVEPYDLSWVEEPVRCDDYDGVRYLAEHTRVPLAMGDNEYMRQSFKDLMVHAGVMVLQPDAIRVGGALEWLRVAHMAAAFDRVVVPHAVQEIHVSLAAAVDNAPMVEWFDKSHPNQEFMSQVIVGPAGDMEAANGCVQPHDAPGLGIAFDMGVVERYELAEAPAHA